MNQAEFEKWRAERLAALPPQGQETTPKLLFVEVELGVSQKPDSDTQSEDMHHRDTPVCVSTICEDKHTGFQDSDTLAGEIKYVTDWPETPGGRWTEQGTYYEQD